MAALLSLGRASYRYEGAPTPILDALTLAISRGDRIAITGPNGCGKSTLLRLLAGDLEPTAGEVARRRGLAIASMLQELGGDAVLAGRTPIELVGGPHARRLLGRLGVPSDRRTVPLAELSGGQRSRVQLARVLAAGLDGCDLVLLDEPTNHLDTQACEQLDLIVARQDAAVAFATHDRRLLETTATSVLAFDGRGGMRFDRGTWAEHLERSSAAERTAWNDWAAGERRRAAAERAAQQRMRLASAMRVDPGTGRETKHFHYRKRAAKVERTGKVIRRRAASVPVEPMPWRDGPTPKLAGAAPSRSGVDAVTITDGLLGWQAQAPVLDGVQLHVARGERVLISGPNGSGKTTLLRTIEGATALLGGEVELGLGTRIVTVAQVFGAADDARDPVEFCRAGGEDVSRGQALELLAALQVRERLLGTPFGQLSEGTRRKVAIASMLLRAGNVLLLDEPTNHLDLRTRMTLEELLADFAGTVLFATHDRAFAEAVATNEVDVRQWSVSC